MKKIILVLSFLFLVFPLFSKGAISNWQKAASITPRNSTDFESESFRQSVRNFQSANGNAVSLIIPYYQSSCNSADVQRGGNTPTDASLRSAISFIDSLGMQVILKPHLEAWDTWGGHCTWRANIDPQDRNTWFRNYENMLRSLAAISPGVTDEIVVGSELIRIATGNNPDNTTRWNTMISNLRSVFNGRLTYSANWGEGDFSTETSQIQFWSSLDDIGISGYYPLRSATNEVADIRDQWAQWERTNVAPLRNQYGKPVKFTEIGYQSVNGARYEPWNYDRRWWAGHNPTEQANLYEALFQYWDTQDYFQGINIWQWEPDPNAGGNGNTDYTPQNKPAQEVIARYFEGGSTPPPPPPPPANISFGSSAGIVPSNPNVNQSLTVNASVTNTSNAAVNGVLVDFEVYNSSNNRVHQTFHQNQNFIVNETKNYSFDWTPSSPGTYTVKIGVFNGNWTANHHWNGNAATFTVGSSTNPPPPPIACSSTIPSGSFAACYFNSVDLTGSPALSRNEAAINHDFGPGSPHTSIDPDTFSAQWRGNFSFDPATYDFTVTADDGIRMWIGTEQVLNQWVDQPASTFSFSKPMGGGTHLIRVDYFENTGNAVAQVSWQRRVSQDPPPPSTNIEIWWPTNESTISGTQPFQSILTNTNLNIYNMYWQVDGGTQNLMNNDSTGYPHKRAWIDVSGWMWNGSGPYRINFVAKNLEGTVIAQRHVDVHVAR